jgi:hypothetical protein
MQHWGEPRLTRDIDVSLMTGFGSEHAVVDKIVRCTKAGSQMLASSPASSYSGVQVALEST